MLRVPWLLFMVTAGCDRVLQLDLRDAAIDAPAVTWNAPQGDLALPVGTGDDPA